MGNADRKEPLTLIGPKGLERVVSSLRVIAPELPFEIHYREITEPEQIFEMDGYRLKAFRVNHNVLCYGYTMDVTEGQRVKKGQLLFVIDQVPYQAALNTAKANLEAAKASSATAELTYESTKRLFDEKVVSEFDLQKSENSMLSAKATVAQMQAQLVNAKNNLSYTEVKSPADGRVFEVRSME